LIDYGVFLCSTFMFIKSQFLFLGIVLTVLEFSVLSKLFKKKGIYRWLKQKKF